MVSRAPNRSAQAGYLLWETVIALLMLGAVVAAIYPNLSYRSQLSLSPPPPYQLDETRLNVKLAQQRQIQILLLQQ